MNYKQYPVHPALRKWIRYYWSYEAHCARFQTFRVCSFADRYPRLVFQDVGSASFIREQSGGLKPLCYVSGIDTKPTETFWESDFSHFGVSFRPHGLHAILGMDAEQLTDTTPDVCVLDMSILQEALMRAKSHELRVRAIEAYFFQQLSRQKRDAIIDDIFSRMNTSFEDDHCSIVRWSREYNISERQLQRRFKASVGISARTFARIERFEESVKMLSGAAFGQLTDIAYTLNYADQAHFINDFKRFSGMTPYEFIKHQNLGSESASFIYLD